jgi:predicted transcriptional regulator
MTDAVGEIGFLAKSEHRVRLLTLLSEHERLSDRELRRRTDASRTTVGRNLAALETRGWIRRTNSECVITRQGRLVADAFDGLVDTVTATDGLHSFMQWVPEGALDIDLRLLADAEVLLAKPGDPWAMVNKHVSTIRETSDDRIMLPVTGLHAFQALHRKIVNGDGRAEVVLEPDVAATFVSNPAYAPLFAELRDTDRFEARVYDGEMPYYLGVLDGTVQIGVDEDGEPRALLETDGEAVVNWAADIYERYRRHSEPLRSG